VSGRQVHHILLKRPHILRRWQVASNSSNVVKTALIIPIYKSPAHWWLIWQGWLAKASLNRHRSAGILDLEWVHNKALVDAYAVFLMP
jgi:hypothetical protein